MWNFYIPTERKPGQQSKINILIQKNWKPTPVGPLLPPTKKTDAQINNALNKANSDSLTPTCQLPSRSSCDGAASLLQRNLLLCKG